VRGREKQGKFPHPQPKKSRDPGYIAGHHTPRGIRAKGGGVVWGFLGSTLQAGKKAKKKRGHAQDWTGRTVSKFVRIHVGPDKPIKNKTAFGRKRGGEEKPQMGGPGLSIEEWEARGPGSKRAAADPGGAQRQGGASNLRSFFQIAFPDRKEMGG